MFYQTNMISYEEFICNQIFLLEQEKEFDRENQKDERKKYGNIYGKVINQSVPPYFGVTVTFRLKITGEQGTGNPFKQGSPIIIEVISTKEKFQGTVMIVRYLMVNHKMFRFQYMVFKYCLLCATQKYIFGRKK